MKYITFALALLLAAASPAWAQTWTAPTAAPPAGNTSAPINVGTTDQVKNGGLSVNAFSAFLNAYFAQKVGIGTVSPQNKLTVQTTSAGTGATGSDGTGGVRVSWTSGYGVSMDAWDGSNPYWGILSFSANTPTVKIGGNYNSSNLWLNPTGGNVGIGTVSPSAPLSISKGVTAYNSLLSLEDTGTVADTSSGIDWKNTQYTWNQGRIAVKRSGTSSSFQMQFFPALNGVLTASPSLVIDPSGNVGVGTTAPGQKLDVAGYVKGTGVCIGTDCRTAWPSGATGSVTSVTAGTGLTASPNPITTTGTISADTTYLQRRVTGTCAAGNAIQTIAADGTVTCQSATAATPTLQTVTNAGNSTTAGITAGGLTASGGGDVGAAISLINTTKSGANLARTWNIYNMTGGYSNSLQFWAYDTVGCGGGLCTPRFQINDNGTVSVPSGMLSVPTTGISAAAITTTGGAAFSGSVGIGTNAPTGKLNVVAPNGDTSALTLTGGGSGASGFLVSEGPYIEVSANSAGSGYRSWGAYNNGSAWVRTYTGLPLSNITQDTSGNISLDTDTNTSGTPSFTSRLFVKNSGSIGIGSIAPASNEKLRVETPEGVWGLSLSRSGTAIGGLHSNGGITTLASNSGGAYVAVANNGNVGVGTTNPGYKLDVAGDINFTGTLRQNGVPFTSGGQWTASGANISNANTGNVGIGNASPAYKLDVNGTGHFNGNVMFGNGGQADFNFEDQSTFRRLAFHELRFYDWEGGGDMLTLNNGNVGIGNTAPGYKLDVTGTVNASSGLTGSSLLTTGGASITGNLGVGTASPGRKVVVYGGHNGTELQLYSTGDGGSNTGILNFWASEPGLTYTGVGMGNNIRNYNGSATMAREVTTRGGSYMRLLDNEIRLDTVSSAGSDLAGIVVTAGNVGIGKVPSGTYKLDVNGSVGAGSYFYTSDRSLKNNIQTLDGSLSKILDLRGVSFEWKDSGKKSVGLVAQEVEKVYPELVGTNEETGLKSVEYGNLVAPLIEAVKEQQKEIEALKAEVELLKASR